MRWHVDPNAGILIVCGNAIAAARPSREGPHAAVTAAATKPWLHADTTDGG